MSDTKQRFKVLSYENPRTGSKSWRVTGTKRDGTRIRENYSDEHSAKCRHIELESEFLKRETETTIRATKLTDVQIHLAEMAFSRLSDDSDLPRAVEHWITHGKQQAVTVESPRIDDAVDRFKLWLEGKAHPEHPDDAKPACTLRDHSKRGLRLRVGRFADGIGNLRVSEITPDTVAGFLDKLDVSPVTRDNFRRAISSFFSWSIERKRRWARVNPCKEVRVDLPEKAPPSILTLKQCKALLRAAEPAGLAPYVAVCLFGGLRPSEAERLTWPAVNLKDREIRLEGNQTKTGKPRVVAICDTLHAWLKAHEGKSFFIPNWRKAFDAAKTKAKITDWPVDVMRHTAISHYFRKTGSYGQTAEQFGNSEAIIKNHYQGRVSSDDTKKFYAILPKKGTK